MFCPAFIWMGVLNTDCCTWPFAQRLDRDPASKQNACLRLTVKAREAAFWGTKSLLCVCFFFLFFERFESCVTFEVTVKWQGLGVIALAAKAHGSDSSQIEQRSPFQLYSRKLPVTSRKRQFYQIFWWILRKLWHQPQGMNNCFNVARTFFWVTFTQILDWCVDFCIVWNILDTCKYPLF